MPMHRELTNESIERLRGLLAQLDLVCREAAELSEQIAVQMKDHKHAMRSAASDAPSPEPRRVRRKN